VGPQVSALSKVQPETGTYDEEFIFWWRMLWNRWDGKLSQRRAVGSQLHDVKPGAFIARARRNVCADPQLRLALPRLSVAILEDIPDHHAG